MPYATVYVTNGGYGGTMLGIINRLPLIVAGVHEGKNEICARVGYFKLGINLRTERPTPAAIDQAVNRIVNDREYKDNVKELAAEFSRYDPYEKSARFIMGVKQLRHNSSTSQRSSFVIPFSN